MTVVEDLAGLLADRRLIPFTGPGILALEPVSVPTSPAELVQAITRRTAVPGKLRTNLPGAAQFIENFKHRKTLDAAMGSAFEPAVRPNALHRLLAACLPPLIVHAWYDDAFLNALAWRRDWGMVQGVSQSEHMADVVDPWFAHYDADQLMTDAGAAAGWRTLVYQPFGCVRPARHYVVSDSDFVEVLTEIDIQTPIPPAVRHLRTGRRFLFLGLRFSDQLARSYARQVAKRSGERHFAVIEGPLTRNEQRFVEELGIEVIDVPLATFTAALRAAVEEQPRGTVPLEQVGAGAGD